MKNISNWSLWMDFHILMKTVSVDANFVVTTLVLQRKVAQPITVTSGF